MSRIKFDPSLLPPAPDLTFESALWRAGVRRVAGVDEAGRGALAGPVCAGAVILPADPAVDRLLSGVRDSKEMTPADRERWAVCIRHAALACAVGFASHREIDQMGIVSATRLAMRRALETLVAPPEHLLVDYLHLPDVHLPQISLVKGDRRSLSIAAASVLAKTERDAEMLRFEGEYPGYGFAAHKGYGTREHRRRIVALGPCAIHRLSFTLDHLIDGDAR